MELSIVEIKQCIYPIRGQQVMLDVELADIYGITPKRLNEQVRRNESRFPLDFMFQLLQCEYDFIKSQFSTLKTKGIWGQHRKYLPLVFTEQGAIMLSRVLKSERAIEMNVSIMRAFIQLRQSTGNYDELKTELSGVKDALLELGRKIDKQSENFFHVIESLRNTQSTSKGISPQALLDRSQNSSETLLGENQKQVSIVLPKSSYTENISVHVERGSHIRVEVIQQAVAKHYGLKLQDLKASNRSAPVALARQIGMYLVRELTRLGYREIGACFGRKDHTTVLHACRKIKEEIEKNSNTGFAVETIKRSLQS